MNLLANNSTSPARRSNQIWKLAFGLIWLTLCWQRVTPIQAQEAKKVRVFVLAGQSNMQGQGVVDLDHEEHYNGGKGSLAKLVKVPESRHLLHHLVDGEHWGIRKDVFVSYQTEKELKAGPLTVGFSGYPGKHHIGPELQFGHVVGNAFEEPVLLIKTAWGGKSLAKDFRPPSAEGETGVYYKKMISEVKDALDALAVRFPSLAEHQPVIEGFVWQQGWNDMVDAEATAQYAGNLKLLIDDVRRDLGVASLPFVFGELGNGGDKVSDGMKRFRSAQNEVAKMELPNVHFVRTAKFARPAENSPNKTHGHHWFGNAESYFLIGDALGRKMVEQLIPESKRKRVLILGDSISMGYTNEVRRLLSPYAHVVRATNPKGRPENCQGTDHGIKRIKAWLELEGGNWDVIHFNFGLHDLKHVHPESGKNSNDPKDPYQTSPEEYEKQLTEIVKQLVKTRAKLIFCTTTPVPEGVSPAREPKVVGHYNKVARRVIEACQEADNPIRVNDLYQFADRRLEEIQRPKNVHFTRLGSQWLASEVAKQIRISLDAEIEPRP